MNKFLNHLIIGGLGLFCIVYLLNPTLGVIELIPDNVPILGNLDEAGAAALLLSCLAYFGLDLTRLFRKAERHHAREEGRKDDGPIIDLEESKDHRG